MLETSSDILNIVLSFSILLVAVLISVVIYNVIKIIHDFRQMSKSIKAKIETIDDILKTIKEKIEHSATYFTLLVDLVTKVVDHLKSKKESDSDKPSKQKKPAKGK